MRITQTGRARLPFEGEKYVCVKVAQRCCGAPARTGRDLVRNTQKNRAQRCVTKPFLVIFEAKIVRNMNRSCYACATLKSACPVLVILIHPNADYAEKHVLLRWHRRNTNGSCYARILPRKLPKTILLHTTAHAFLPNLRGTHKIFFPFE